MCLLHLYCCHQLPGCRHAELEALRLHINRRVINIDQSNDAENVVIENNCDARTLLRLAATWKLNELSAVYYITSA